MTVYSAYRREIVFEGTRQECLDWMFSQADTLSNGGKLYRTWTIDGDTYYDVGNVYIFNGDKDDYENNRLD